MGRRGVETMTPKEIREQAAKHFRKLSSASGVNLAQFRGQIHEEEMVEILVGFAKDITVATSLRRQCALDVIAVARGPLAPWYHDGKTVNPQAVGDTGNPVAKEIDDQRKTSQLFIQLDELIRTNTDPSTWPNEVRLIAGDMLPSLEESWREDQDEG